MGIESPARATLQVHSFRVVFALERRIHRIDRWRLPLPYGVPVRGLAYAAAILLATILAARLPAIGPIIAVLPAPVRFVLLPGFAAFALDRARVDGRPAHNFLIALARHRFGPRHLTGFRAAPPIGYEDRVVDDLTLLPDERAPSYRRARVKGPAQLRLAYPAAGTQRGRRLVLTQASAQPLRSARLLTIPTGAEVEFR